MSGKGKALHICVPKSFKTFKETMETAPLLYAGENSARDNVRSLDNFRVRAIHYILLHCSLLLIGRTLSSFVWNMSVYFSQCKQPRSVSSLVL